MKPFFKKMFESCKRQGENAGFAIKDILTTAILTDKKLRGMELPSLSELAHYFNVSKSFVHRVYHDLEKEGLVVTANGKLTRVVMHLPSELLEDANAATAASAHSYGRWAYFNAESPIQTDIPQLDRMLGKSPFASDPAHTPEKKAALTKYITLKLRIHINKYVSVPFAADELLVANGYKTVLFNLVSTLMKGREVIAVTERCSATAYTALSLCKKEVFTVGEDEYGIMTTDVEELCRDKKLGILYLNTNAGQLRDNEISAKRLAHLIALSKTHQFIIIEDNHFGRIDSVATDPLMEAVYEENVRLIYLAPLTFIHSNLNDIIIVCGAAAHLNKVHAQMAGMYDMMPYPLAYSVYKLIESGRLQQVEKLVTEALNKVLVTATEEFLACGLWKAESVLNPKGWFFCLEPVSGALPDNLAAELQNLRIYLADAGHTILVDPVNPRLVISLAAYLFNPHLVEDIRRLNDAIKPRLIHLYR
jgi:DNA-binding transcriptional MocR family regulator